MREITDLEGYRDECVNIDRSDLQTEFCRVPGDLAFWAERLASTESRIMEAKVNIDRVRSKIDQDVRAAFQARGDKLTEARISVLVDGDMQLAAAQTALAAAMHEKSRLRGIVDAIALKGQMLMSLGAIVRQEMRTNDTHA